MSGSDHLVDPELRPLLAMISDAFTPTLATLPAMRMRTEAGARMFGGAGAPEARVEVAPPGVEVRLQIPPGGGAGGAIYHIHGGGFVAGSAAAADARNWQRALAFDAVVVSVEYRLAPEVAFPGPLEDCYAGLRWLAANAAALRVDPGRIVVVGESAGGGLAAALALLARDRGGPRLAGQVLAYPMLDHRTAGPDDLYGNRHAGEHVWNQEANRFGWRCMQGDYDLSEDGLAYFSPARAADLSDLPPTFIGVGALDLFVDEDLDFAARLGRAGVPVEAHLYPGAFHAFDLAADSAVAQRFADDIAAAVRRMLRG
jgi:acetyl esterase